MRSNSLSLSRFPCLAKLHRAIDSGLYSPPVVHPAEYFAKALFCKTEPRACGTQVPNTPWSRIGPRRGRGVAFGRRCGNRLPSSSSPTASSRLSPLCILPQAARRDATGKSQLHTNLPHGKVFGRWQVEAASARAALPSTLHSESTPP